MLNALEHNKMEVFNITRVYLELQCCFVLHWLLTLAEFFSIK